MAKQVPPGLLGIHTNMPGAVPPDIFKAVQIGNQQPSGLSAEEGGAFGRLKDFFAKEVGYARDGVAPTDANRNCGFARWPRSLDD